MIDTMLHTVLPLALALSPLQDWNNLGGNARRNGFAQPLAPASAALHWSNPADPSIIAWHPYVDEGRVFTIRESGFPQNGGAANDALIAYDLDTGTELWRVTLPFGGNTSTEWIAWIAGARDGRVYASRSSNLKPGPVRAFDAASGALLWTSALATEAWATDGVVFTADGDLLIGDRLRIARIDGPTGATLWSTPRTCSVSGDCGPAAAADALFIDEVAPGGQVITKVDAQTGQKLYQSPVMTGFLVQRTPFLSHDGRTVYFGRVQNNPAVDFLYAFQDTGTALVQDWSVPADFTTPVSHGIGPDGSIYMVDGTGAFVRLDPETGAVTGSAGVLAPLASPRVAVDAAGRVYLCNGWADTPATDGRLWAFTPDLSQQLFTLVLDNPNQGGPAIAEDGTLLVCDRTAVRAWRETGVPQTYCASKPTSDGCLASAYGVGVPSATAGTGFTVGASQVTAGDTGLFFYSKTGPAAVPFLGGTLCLAGTITRTPGRNSGGTAPCSGAFALDFNAYAASGVDAALVAGQPVWGQYWFRDPESASGVGLSNGLAFQLGP